MEIIKESRMKKIKLNFKKRPSFFNTLVKICLGRSYGFKPKKGIPEIIASWEKIKVNEKHLRGFNKICGINDSNEFPITYPLTLVCPLYLRILAQKKAPLSLFQALNTRCKIIQHRKIGVNEIMDIQSKLMDWRVVEKGLELDLYSAINIRDEIVWENTNTYYYRGRFGEADADFLYSKLEPIPDAEQLGKWFFPAGVGFKFARISGDTNGLHFMPRYSRMLGYKRDFAQPFLMIANSIEYLPDLEDSQAICLEAEIKGPIYYNSELSLKNLGTQEFNRFDVYCQDNPRPCLSGKQHLLATTNRE